MKKIIKFLVILAMSFISIYLLMFFIGWALFETKSPILMEFAVSLLVAMIFYVMDSLAAANKNRIETLENRITELESLLKAEG